MRYTKEDYLNAPSGEGPLADTWVDKPHRLVYDLLNEIDRLEIAHRSEMDFAKSVVMELGKSVAAEIGYVGQEDGDALIAALQKRLKADAMLIGWLQGHAKGLILQLTPPEYVPVLEGSTVFPKAYEIGDMLRTILDRFEGEEIRWRLQYTDTGVPEVLSVPQLNSERAMVIVSEVMKFRTP